MTEWRDTEGNFPLDGGSHDRREKWLQWGNSGRSSLLALPAATRRKRPSVGAAWNQRLPPEPAIHSSISAAPGSALRQDHENMGVVDADDQESDAAHDLHYPTSQPEPCQPRRCTSDHTSQ